MRNNKKIKISVIMPSYNVAQYIKRCMASVVGQTLSSIEILCVDAGSTDGTTEIIREYEKADPRVHLICADKKSYGYQMNVGIKEAQGEYIGIVETDDFVDTDMFEVLYNKAKISNADVVKGILYEVYENENGRLKECLIDYIPDDTRYSALFSPETDPSVHKWDGNIWNGIYRRGFLVDHCISFNETYGAAFQDIGFQQIVLNEASSILYVRNHFYHYLRVRAGNSTWNPRCMRYIYQEYKRLLSYDRLKNSHTRWIYARMIVAFLDEFDKALCYADFNVAQLDCPEAVEWLRREALAAIKSGELIPGDLAPYQRDRMYSFLIDEKGYINSYERRTKYLLKWLEALNKKIRNRNIVIFGAGQYGIMLVLFLLRNGIFIDGLADNDRTLHNSSYYGWNVLSADDAIRCFSGGYFVIANRRYGKQIASQLIDKGISEEQILFFDGSDRVLVEEIMKQPILVRNCV